MSTLMAWAVVLAFAAFSVTAAICIVRWRYFAEFVGRSKRISGASVSR